MQTKSRHSLGFIFLLFLGTIISPSLLSQEHSFEKYSEDEGLASKDIYDLLVSGEGYLWLATDNGVAKYDGTTFTNYGVEDGLATNTVIKLYEDIFGRIWFLSYNGMLSYYKQGIVQPYEFNDSVIKYFSDNYIGKIQVDTNRNLILSPRQGGKGVIDTNGNVFTRAELVPIQVDSCYLFFEDRGNDHFITIQNEVPAACTKGNKLSYCGDSYYIKVDFTTRQFQRKYLKTAPQKYIVSFRNIIYVIQDHELINIKVFGDEIISIYQDLSGNIWISEKYDNGVYMYDNEMLDGNPQHFLKGYTVTRVLQDNEKNFWMSTEGGGVFFTPGFDFKRYTIPGDDRNLNVMALAISGNRMWFSTRDKDIYSANIRKGNLSNFRKVDIEEPFDWIKHILIDRDGYLWLSSTRNLRYDPAGFARPPDTIVNGNFLAKGKGDTIFCANKMLGIYYKKELVNLVTQEVERRIYSGFHQNDDFWLGTLYGLYVYRDSEFQYAGGISDALSDRINCINQIGDLLVIGTASNGLAFVKKDSLINSLSMEQGLLDNGIKYLFVQDDTTLWVGTKKGLNKVIIRDKTNSLVIEGYGQGDGLPSNEISGIAMHDGYIWLATSSGLVSFDPQKIVPHLAPPSIHINSVQINGRDTILSDLYNLDHNQNDIRINFSGISFRHEGGARYRYMMSDYNDDLVDTKNNWASFPNLSPGDYTFYVNVGNVHGIWNEAPRTINFKIKKHYSQTTGFMILLVALSILAVYSITMIILKQRKIKDQARNELARMEQKIFRLQMNPHFVFNALLAIQGFMYQRNTQDAGRYLTSFAKLIRHTLYGSREESISLDKEIEAMKYYLELQRLRFNDNFEFFIDVGEDIVPESIQLPPLLIQPFLENAIEHGLQHKTEAGNLYLRVVRIGPSMHIEIEDDGIGRERSLENQKRKGKLHKSLGMDIVQSRISSLNKIIGKEITLEIIDLKDDKQQPNGTLVRIVIPN